MNVPLLSLCNTRPGFTLDAGERVIHLSELSPRQTCQLIASLLDGDDPPDDLVELVSSRADGNPFFVEEIVNSLLESDVLTRDTRGDWQLSSSIDQATVPSTVRGVIASRIDRLDPVRRRVLQQAAVVGREFLYRVW